MNDAAGPALLASLSNIFESVAVRAQIKTEDYNDSELGRQLRNALTRVRAAALTAEQRFEDAKGKYPHLDVPPARQLPADIVERGGENVLAPLRAAAPPKRTLQKDLTKTKDYYDNMVEYFDPCLLGLPSDWDKKRKVKYMRSMNRKACARNGTGVYRLGVGGAMLWLDLRL